MSSCSASSTPYMSAMLLIAVGHNSKATLLICCGAVASVCMAAVRVKTKTAHFARIAAAGPPPAVTSKGLLSTGFQLPGVELHQLQPIGRPAGTTPRREPAWCGRSYRTGTLGHGINLRPDLHCSFNRVIRHRTFVPGAIFADFSMARQAGLRVTG